MASKGILSGVEERCYSGLVAHHDCGRNRLAAGPSAETAGILLGADFDHRGRAIHHTAADAGLATLCWDSTRSSAGRGDRHVLQSERVGLRCGYFLVRNAGVVIARGRRLPVCSNYAEYHFADQPRTSALDCRVASVSGSVVGDCGGAGGHDSVAAGEESAVGERDSYDRIHNRGNHKEPAELRSAWTGEG